MTARRSLTGLLSLALAAGCTVEVDFDPQGTDVSLSGSWTINGQPASVATCDAAGIDFLGLGFFNDGSSHFYGDDPEDPDEVSLIFPCADGDFSTGPVLEFGRYDVQWQAFERDEEGRLRQLGVRGERFTLDARSESRVVLAPVDFVTDAVDFDPRGVDASLEVDWDVDAAAPTETSCADADIANVQIVFYAEDDTAFANGVIIDEIACAEGKYNSMPENVVAEGRYMTSLVAVDAENNVVGESTPLLLVVDASLNTHYRLQKWDFAAPSLRLALTWDIDPTKTMEGADCTEAGVDEFSYRLYLGEEEELVDQSEMLDCTQELVIEGLEPGEYTINIDAENAAGAIWMGTCEGLVVENGVEMYNCEVDMLEAP